MGLFSFASKRFSKVIRLLETGLWPEIGLRRRRCCARRCEILMGLRANRHANRDWRIDARVSRSRHSLRPEQTTGVRDFAVIRFLAFADAAFLRAPGTGFAGAKCMSRDRTLNDAGFSGSDTVLSLLLSPVNQTRDKPDLGFLAPRWRSIDLLMHR